MDAQDTSSVTTSPELKQRIGLLYQYIAKRLGIKTAPSKVIFTDSETNSKNPFGLTGYYDHENKLIRIYVTNRHDTDILRTFAHEMIHHWQNERGTLHPSDKTDKTLPITNNMQPGYAQNDAWLRRREMEAYLFGCLLFRDWQDENRNGPPKTPPTMPQPLDENLRLDGGLTQKVDVFVKDLIASKVLTSYHRELSSGDMNPEDFAEDLTHKIMEAIEEWTETINNRGNWENQSNMIK